MTDLTAEDFELREDDVAQKVGSFTRVSRGDGIGVNVALGSRAAPRTRDAASARGRRARSRRTHPSVTALVFDALSAEAVGLCQRAALE